MKFNRLVFQLLTDFCWVFKKWVTLKRYACFVLPPGTKTFNEQHVCLGQNELCLKTHRHDLVKLVTSMVKNPHRKHCHGCIQNNSRPAVVRAWPNRDGQVNRAGV